MNLDQFQEFLRVQKASNGSTASMIETQTRHIQENGEKHEAQAQAKRVAGCDGSTTRRLRQWFRDVELTIPYTKRTLFVAAQTAEGALRVELERFLDTAEDRRTVEWNVLKTHLTTTFLSKHEADRMRDEIEKVQQGAYETTAAYGRRFREAADLGYPKDNRNVDQQCTMLGAYLRGMRDRKVVE